MYFAAQFINVKLSQDYAESFESEGSKALVICDGIGEFEQSGQVSILVSEYFKRDVFNKNIEEFIQDAYKELIARKIVGGTTLICAIQESISNIELHYLGNGGIVHFYGDFANNPYSTYPYRFSDIMLPHITPDGALTRHISHNSGEYELSPSSISMTLNHMLGDILILFSDGIGSLEEKVIIKDDDNRLWRHENQAIQIIMMRLHQFMSSVSGGFNPDLLNGFLNDTLSFLKEEKLLEDDASLGIVLTEKVITYYNTLTHDQRIN